MEKINFKNIKAIVFDYDGTMYNTKDKNSIIWLGWGDYILDLLEKIIAKHPEKNFQQIVQKYKLKKYNMLENFIEMSIQEFGNANEILEALTQNTYDIEYNNLIFIKNETLQKFAENFPLYIVSNTRTTTIKHQLSKVGVSEKYFQDIISNNFSTYDLSKKDALLNIVALEGITPNQLLFFGDNQILDIECANKIGVIGIYAPNLTIIEDFINKYMAYKNKKKHLSN